MNSTNQTIEKISSSPNISIPTQQINQMQPQSSSNFFLYTIAFTLLILLFLFIFKRKSKGIKKEIGIVGQRNSGKTQLFISLSGGKSFNTVPSISNNTSQLELSSKNYQLTDFIGDNLSKQEVINEIARFHTLIHVVDGTDSKKLGDVALFIYRVLVSKLYQKEQCNYLLFLNKNDEKGFHGVEKLVKRIEDQIQTIKNTRKNQTEDNQGQEDYLRNDRSRFDLKKQGIEVLVGSAKEDRKGLVSRLQELCQ